MCAAGFQVSEEGLSRKATRIMTNNPWLAQVLVSMQCDGGHYHVPLQGGLASCARIHPPDLCQVTLAMATGAPPPSCVEAENYVSGLREEDQAEDCEDDLEEERDVSSSPKRTL